VELVSVGQLKMSALRLRARPAFDLRALLRCISLVRAFPSGTSYSAWAAMPPARPCWRPSSAHPDVATTEPAPGLSEPADR